MSGVLRWSMSGVEAEVQVLLLDCLAYGTECSCKYVHEQGGMFAMGGSLVFCTAFVGFIGYRVITGVHMAGT